MAPFEFFELISESGINLEQDAMLVILAVLLVFICKKLDKIYALMKKNKKLKKKHRKK